MSSSRHRRHRRNNPPRAPFCEPLEDRRLLSAVLVKDINLDGASSRFIDMEHVGGNLYVATGDQHTQFRIWTSDGTAAGTTLLKEFVPGRSDVHYEPEFTEFGGELYFVADDGEHGIELWKTDGTAAGTTVSSPRYPGSGTVQIRQLTPVTDGIFYWLGDALYKTDGTPEGTVRIITSGLSHGEPVTLGNTIVYAEWSKLMFVTKFEPWQHYATFLGAHPEMITKAGSRVFFTASVTGNDRELWTSDGTEAGTALVKDVTPGTAGTTFGQVTALGDQAYFTVKTANGWQWWRSDGTAAGTAEIPGAYTFTHDPALYTYVLDDADALIVGGPGLWRVDSTGVTTLRAQGGFGGEGFIGSELRTGRAIGLDDGALLIAGTDETPTAAPVLWRTDGTPDGTLPLSQVSTPWTDGLFMMTPGPAGVVYFAAGESAHGIELWSTSGAADSAALVKDLNPATGHSSAHGMAPAPAIGGAYFVALAGPRTPALWKTDGTSQGTSVVKIVNPTRQPGVEVNGIYLFTAWTWEHRLQLWRSDGTEAGTFMLKDVGANRIGGETLEMVALDGGTVVFTAGDYGARRLWRSDGTPEGTREIAGAYGPVLSDSPAGPTLVRVGNHVLFWRRDKEDIYGVFASLWSTDGTQAGTVRLGGDPDARFTGAYAHDGQLFFWHGPQSLWRSDGTAGGTYRVGRVGLISETTAPRMGGVSGGGIVFGRHHTFYQGRPNVSMLHVTSGAAGDLRTLGEFVGTPQVLDSTGNHAFFLANKTGVGHGLWRTDGTPEGTILLLPHDPGVNGNFIGSSRAYGGLLWFTVNRGAAGELWRSDGTIDGTYRVPGGAPPVLFDSTESAAAEHMLLYRGRGEATGIELYAITRPAAHAGGPYSVTAGQARRLDASGSRDIDPAESLVFVWDLDGDGVFGETGMEADRGDELAESPEFDAAGLAPGVYATEVRVTNSLGLWSDAVADVVVTEIGVQTVVGDETEDDQWTVRQTLGNVQVFRRFGSSLVLEEEWPSSEVRELRFVGGGGDDRVSVFSTLPLTKVVLEGGDGTDTLLFTADNDEGVGGDFERLEVYGGTSLLLSDSLTTEVVELGEGSRLTLAAGGIIELRTKQLLLEPLFGDVLDLNDNRLLVEGGDAGALEALVAASRNASGGAWTGAGITSTLAKTQAMRGVGVTSIGSDVRVGYGYDGDANGDGRVNADDYFRIDSGFLDQPQNPTYAQGDFNFDDTINADDYFLIDSAFLGQGQPAAAREVAVTAADVASAQVEPPAVRKKGKVVKRGGEEPFQTRRRVAAVARRGR